MTSRKVDGVTTTREWDVTSSMVESGAPVKDANGVFGPPGQGGHVVDAYDASGQRVAQARVADADGLGTATGYVASGKVEDPNTATTSTGDVTATRYYTFGGSTVAVRTNDGKLALMLGDEQGSTSVAMAVTVQAGGALASATLNDAATVTRTSYTPYGELRGEDNPAVDRGWLGQVEDRVSADGASGTGLTYLNARYYDPATHRFISPDPIVNPANPITLDAYEYAANNPVVFTDANGMCYSGKGARGYNGSTLEANCAAPTDKQLWATVTGTDIEKTIAAQQACRDKGKCGRAKGQTPVSCAYNKYCRGTPEADLGAILGGVTMLTCLAATGGAGSVGCAALGGAVSGFTSYMQNTPSSQQTFGGGAKATLTDAAIWGVTQFGIGLLFKGVAALVGKGVSPGPGTVTAGASSVRYGPMNPGPLEADIVATFRSGSYTSTTTTEPTILYRAWGGSSGEFGPFWSRTQPSGPLQAQMDFALDPAWGNTATSVATIRVPAGTTFYEGVAAPQGGLLGGGNQIYIPGGANPAWAVP